MRTIKSAHAEKAALDWLVWKATGGIDAYPQTASGKGFLKIWKGNSSKHVHPSPDWAHGGPIKERAGIASGPCPFGGFWAGKGCIGDETVIGEYGPTELIAIARCYVTSCMGDIVEVPEELL